MEGKEKKKSDWIRLASKSRAGRFYLFNKSTGETKWLPLQTSSEKECKFDSPPKLNRK